MHTLIYVLLRRLRMPLLVLIMVYAISMLGLVMIPGVDDQGQVWRMSFFHAFYFVSFMGSTIGFGEIPYPFTDAQRMWTLVCIYGTVIAWLYAIGTTLATVQDPAFIRLIRTRRFANKVRALQEPFYLVCGYGTTGREVVSGLEGRGIRSVVLDIDQSRIDLVELEEFALPALSLCVDASLPDNLAIAGLQKNNCLGVLALTDRDHVNLAVAIASKLLLPKRMVVSRSENDVTSANLASFGTDLIINPFKQFADYMGLAVRKPQQHLVVDWLLHPRHRPLSSIYKHATGRWILCGYGRFGKALREALVSETTDVTLIEPDEANIDALREFVKGVGTEAITLEAANIKEAVGIIAGTPNDADNMSIIMTARTLNPKLITVARQNHSYNELMFSNSKADFVMQPGHTIATRILAHIRTPLLDLFITHLLQQDEVWCHTLINRISQVVSDEKVDSRCFDIDYQQTPAVCKQFDRGRAVTIRALTKKPYKRSENLDCFALMLKRGDETILVPGELTELVVGDRLLFCGRATALDDQRWVLENEQSLGYVLTGSDDNPNPILRWIRSYKG